MMTINYDRLTLENAQKASDDWGFNCGPAALCAITNRKPDEIRPHLGEFENKGYMNPTMMKAAIASIKMSYRPLVCERHQWVFPSLGLVRIQFDGPWTKPGVPIAARYKHTHWVAINRGNRAIERGSRVFDVNALCNGGWIPMHIWQYDLLPWLIAESVPKGNGQWWPTHCWEMGE